jgi:uncharacterized protein YcbK (DUF882 family)
VPPASGSPFFNLREFECKCGLCARQTISTELVKKLHKIRTELGLPITVTSGYRCAAYQARLRGSLPVGHTAKGRSSHEAGNAADLACRDMDKLLKLCESEFKAIGVASTFVHVDTRSDKLRRWKYA